MDRRALLFIISLTLALFAVKISFSYFEEQDRTAWIEKEKLNQAKKQTEEKKKLRLS